MKATPGVRRFMRGSSVDEAADGSGERLALLPDSVIYAIRDQEQAALARAIPLERQMRGRTRAPLVIKPGDQVRLTEEAGPFAGLYARLIDTDEGQRIKLAVDLFGRETTMTVAADAVELVDNLQIQHS